jgi:hypothetical protein
VRWQVEEDSDDTDGDAGYDSDGDAGYDSDGTTEGDMPLDQAAQVSHSRREPAERPARPP